MKEFISFYMCRIATGIVDWLCMFFFVVLMNLNDLVIKIGVNMLVVILNYIASKLVILKKRNEYSGRAVTMGKEKRTWRNLIPYAFIIFCGFIMSLNTTNNPFHIGYTDVDSSVFHYVSRVIIHGGMPYRDTFDHKGPLIYLIDAFGILINEQIGIWIMELIAILITFLFAYKIARLVGCNRLGSCAVVAVNVVTLSYHFQGGNLVEEYACLFITISLYIFLKFFMSGNVKAIDLVICGASFAAVCLLRINMIALWAIMCIGVMIDRMKKGKSKELIGFVIWFLIGAIVVTAPIMIWLIANDAFYPFIEDYFLFNFMYSSDAGRASIIKVIFSMITFCCGLPAVIGIPPLLYYCVHERKLIDWLCFFSFALSLPMMCISGQLYSHYGMILCPIVTYAVSRFVCALEVPVNSWERKKKTAFSLSLALALILLFAYNELTLAKYFIKTSLPDYTDAHEIAAIVRDNTSDEDTISVCGNRDIIYLLSDRESVSKYSYQSPIAEVNPQIKQEYLDDIRSKKAKIIVMDEKFIMYSDISAIIEDDYNIISTVGSTNIYLKTASE